MQKPETRHTPEDTTARSDPWQQTKTAALRTRISFGTSNCQFNERILVDVMYLYEDPSRHIIDEGTHLSTAKFFLKIQVGKLYKTILDWWVVFYTDMIHRIRIDLGSSFR